MVRDDVIRRRLLEDRPEPSPDFLKKIEGALAHLPARKRVSKLFGMLPVSAIVFVTVAAACVMLLNSNALNTLFTNNSPQNSMLPAAGDKTATAESQTTKQDTPSPTNSISNRPYSRTLYMSRSDNNITETVLEAGSDGFVLYVRLEFGPVPPSITPSNEMSVNGNGNIGELFCDTNPSEKEGYYTTTLRMYLPDRNKNPSNVTMASKITIGNQFASFMFNLPIQSWQPDRMNLAIDDRTPDHSRSIFLNNSRVHMVGGYQSPQDSVICLEVEDETGDLATYFNKFLYTKDKGNGKDSVRFTGEYPIVQKLIICKGLVDESIVDTLYTPAEGKDAQKAFDTLHGTVFIKNTEMVLKRNDEGKFFLYIVNMNPSLRIDTDLTLIFNTYDRLKGSTATDIINTMSNTVLHIRLQPDIPGPTPSDMQTTMVPSASPGPTPSSGQTTAVPSQSPEPTPTPS